MEDFPRWCIRSTKTILLRFGLIKKTSRAAYFKKVMIQNLVKKNILEQNLLFINTTV